MTGVQRFFGNDRNHVRTATVTASSTLPAADTVIAGTPTRYGYGAVGLTGSYTGADDCTIDIEITAGAGGALAVSTPVFAGAGNGTLSGVTATGIDPQTITVELISLGTASQRARLLLGDVALVAAAAGTGGNGITLTVTPDLTLGAALGVLPEAISAGQAAWSGPAWDWGQPALLADGTVPSGAARVAIGGDTAAIYRAYKVWVDGAWSYRLTPAPIKAYPAGAKVQAVSGDYDALLKQGATEETYTAVTTLYSLLAAIRAGSTLVTVDGVITDDRLPGGMGAIDISYRTAASVQVTGRDGSTAAKAASLSPAVDATARSQTVTVECRDNSAVGSERWTVGSDLLGALGEAITGNKFDSTVQFKIAKQLPTNNADVSLTDISYANRPENDTLPLPQLCLKKGVTGARATSKSITLVYKRRPDSACECDNTIVSGAVVPEFLGLPQLEDINLDTEYKTRLQLLYTYRQTFIADNVAIVDPSIPMSFIPWAPRMSAGPAPVYILPLASNGHYYDWNGLVADIEPAWPVNGSTVFVGDASFKDMGLIKPYMAASANDIQLMDQILGIVGACLGQIYSNATALAAWDDLWDDVQTDLETAAAVGVEADMILHNPEFMEKYRSRCDSILLLADISPGKYEASGAGYAVWQDLEDLYWWEIKGTNYLPVFTNRVYHSAARDSNGAIYSTEEFAFAIACACPHRLIEGDTITVQIGTTEKTYAVGDKITLSVLGGNALQTAGGIAGDDTLTWKVTGSADSFADYELTESELPYSNGGLEMQISRGAIPFALGDKWTFEAEEIGQFKWRKNGGSWSSTVDIAATASLSDGLSVTFARGVAPSFLSGDLFPFQVLQPFAPEHVRRPLPLDDGWKWSGSAPSLYFDLGSAKTVSALGILLHSLPAGATITLGAGATSGATDWTQAIARLGGPIVALFDAQTYRYWRVTLGSASGGAVGWVWMGEPLATTYHATSCSLRRVYSLQRGSGSNPTARYAGAGTAGAVGWENGHLAQTDLDALLSMLDAAKTGDDEPICFLPNYHFPAEAALVYLPDEYEITDRWQLQPNDTARRWLAVSMALEPVIL